MEFIKNKHKLFLTLFLGALSFSLIFTQTVQVSYSQNTRTFDVKAELDNRVIERGDTQTIQFDVEEQQTDLPVAGATVSVEVTYPGGEEIVAVSELTDAEGKATISIPSGGDTKYDTAIVSVLVFLTGFVAQDFNFDYAIISENINEDDDDN